MEELRRERTGAPAEDDRRRASDPRPHAVSNKLGLSPAIRRMLLKVRTA
jgi:hypothetical protein